MDWSLLVALVLAPCVVSKYSASAGRTIELRKKKPAKNHKIGKAKAESKGDGEKLQESRQSASQDFKKMKQKKPGQGHDNIRQKPFDPIFHNKVVTGAEELKAGGSGLIDTLWKWIEKDV